MRIENVSGNKYMTPAAQGGDKAALSDMKRGDSFTARVLDANGESATLKMPDGQIIKAKVEGGAQLFPGQDVEMQVAGNDEGTLTLRVIETLGGEENAPAVKNPLAAVEGGDSRQALASQSLKSLNLPVTRETVAATLRIVDKFPEIGIEKAAFLAASGIPEEMLTPQAVARIFSADAGDMMAKLSSLLDEAVAAKLPQTAGTAAGEASVAAAPGGEAAELPDAAPSSAFPQPAGQMESQPGSALLFPEGAQAASASPASIPAQPAGEAQPSATGAEAAPVPVSAAPQQAEATAQQPPMRETGIGQEQRTPDSDQAVVRLSAAVELVRQFAENPQISSAGEGHMTAFAAMFEEAAQQMAQIVSAPVEEQAALLKDFVDNMFVSIDKWQGDAPGLVRKAREELLVRLSLVQEAVTGTGLENRAEVAREAKGLAEHVKLLGEIGQFGYVQIPVSQGGKQKTAEMYIYRDKRRSKRIDADNVKILLALDTQSMGHLQAFVSIRQKEVSVRLDVGQQQWADYIRMRSPELHSMLAEAGYRLTENRIGVREEPVTVEKAMSALMEYDARPTGLDLKI